MLFQYLCNQPWVDTVHQSNGSIDSRVSDSQLKFLLITSFSGTIELWLESGTFDWHVAKSVVTTKTPVEHFIQQMSTSMGYNSCLFAVIIKLAIKQLSRTSHPGWIVSRWCWTWHWFWSRLCICREQQRTKKVSFSPVGFSLHKYLYAFSGVSLMWLHWAHPCFTVAIYCTLCPPNTYGIITWVITVHFFVQSPVALCAACFNKFHFAWRHFTDTSTASPMSAFSVSSPRMVSEVLGENNRCQFLPTYNHVTRNSLPCMACCFKQASSKAEFLAMQLKNSQKLCAFYPGLQRICIHHHIGFPPHCNVQG